MAADGNVTAAILAGGLGTRLRPVLGSQPKVLAEVRGRPFLAYLLDHLAGAEFREVVLLTGHGADEVHRIMGTTYGPLRLVYSTEPTPLGTGGAVRQALLKLVFPTVLLLNGDTYCDVDLSAFLGFHFQRAAAASLLLTHVSDAARYGRVQLTQDGRVHRFNEKGEASGAGWVNAGVYLLERPLIEAIPSGQVVSLERELLPHWVARAVVRGWRCNGRFLDIGTPESYAEAERFLRTEENAGEEIFREMIA